MATIWNPRASASPEGIQDAVAQALTQFLYDDENNHLTITLPTTPGDVGAAAIDGTNVNAETWREHLNLGPLAIKELSNSSSDVLLGNGNFGSPPAASVAGFSNSTSDTGVNVTVPAVLWAANNNAANVDLVLAPKGSGALILSVPNGVATGGNKRGANAVDLQTLRLYGDQVAAGPASVIAGGERNKANGSWSCISGGYSNVVTSGYSNVGGGYNNNNSSSYSVIAGGQSNQISSAQCSTIGGGAGNAVAGSCEYATVSGGYYNQASGYMATVPGGRDNLASGPYSQASGYGSDARSLHGAHVRSAGIFASRGDAQAGFYIARSITTDTGQKVVNFTNSASPSSTSLLTLPNNSAYLVRASVVARRSDVADEAAAFVLEGLATRASSASTVAVASFAKTVLHRPNSNWDVAVAVDTAVGAVNFLVTGEAGKTIRWVTKLETVEVVG